MKFILLLGALAALGPLSIDMYLPSFPAVEHDLQTSPAMVSATLATFFAGLCIGQLIYGPLSDRVGRRLPLLAGILTYFMATLGCWSAMSIDALLIWRFFQAIGACAGMVVSRAMIRDLFQPHEAARVFSLVMLTMGAAPILAPLLGQLVADVAGWRGIFGIMALFSLGLSVAVWKLVPALRPQSAPALPLLQRFSSVLADPNFVAFAVSGALIQAGLYAYIAGSATLFINELGLSPKGYSVLFGVNAAGLILASQLNTWLLKRMSYQQVLHYALRFAAMAAIALALLGVTGKGGFLVAVPLFLFIGTLGLVFPNSTAGALANQGHQAGTASAVLGVIQYGGGALASAAVGLMSHVSTAPLQLTVGFCGISSVLVFQWLTAAPASQREIAV